MIIKNELKHNGWVPRNISFTVLDLGDKFRHTLKKGINNRHNIFCNEEVKFAKGDKLYLNLKTSYHFEEGSVFYSRPRILLNDNDFYMINFGNGIVGEYKGVVTTTGEGEQITIQFSLTPEFEGIHYIDIYKESLVVNLTNIFGQDNEPTQEEFEELLKLIPGDPLLDDVLLSNTQISNWERSLLDRSNNNIGEIMEVVGIGEPSKRRAMVTFSFDDCNITDYTEAFLYMQSKGMRGTTFFNYGMYLDDNRITLSEEQTKEMADAGWEIACHTYNHAHLTSLTDREVLEEWIENKKAIESLTGKEVVSHGYPFNDQDTRIRNLCSGVYSYACCTDYNTRCEYGYARGLHDLPRFFIDKRSISEIKSRIDEAVENKQWLIFGCHGIQNRAERKNPIEFQEIVDYVYNYKFGNRLDVVTVQEGARRII